MRRSFEFSPNGELPDAPLAMPKQVIERQNAWRLVLRAVFFGAPARS